MALKPRDFNKEIEALAERLNRLREQRDEADEGRALMTKEELIEESKKMTRMDDRFFDVLRGVGAFQTGSTVYGDPITANDEDWVVNAPVHAFRNYVATNIKASGYWNEGNQMQVAYGRKTDGTLVNLICMSDCDQVEAWKKATAAMNTLLSSNLEIDNLFAVKWMRVRVFRALVDIFWLHCIRRSYHSDPITVNDARKWKQCRLCGREAINFTDKAHYDHWYNTGQCERCAPQGGTTTDAPRQ